MVVCIRNASEIEFLGHQTLDSNYFFLSWCLFLFSMFSCTVNNIRFNYTKQSRMRVENPGVPVFYVVGKSDPLVEIGLIDLSKSALKLSKWPHDQADLFPAFSHRK
jgi:hypothetical protein